MTCSRSSLFNVEYNGDRNKGYSPVLKENDAAMATVKITRENFEDEVLKSDKPVLLDFWAEWCGPCRMVAPVVEEISNEVAGTAKVGKINVDEEMELAQAFNVMSIPTLVVVKDGKVANSTVGFQSKEALMSLLK